MKTDRATALNLTFAALADPTRRAILLRLMRGEASVNELVAPFGFSQPTISKHIQVLARAGLIDRGRNAQFRPCRLNAAKLERAWRWIGEYRRFWDESFDRLEAYAKELMDAEIKEEKTRGREKRKTRRR